MKLPTLYKKTSTGKTQIWRVWTEGPTICTEYGLLDGKKQLARKEAKSKNTGKSNETSAAMQAESEAKSMHQHRLDRKYSLTIEETTEAVFLPMLAHKFKDNLKRVTYPVHIQPKLDGLRCLANWVELDDGTQEVQLLSRGGKEYNVAHLKEELSKILPKGYVFDGEIYKHGYSLQKINRLTKKHREAGDPKAPEGSTTLEYHVYDGFWIGEEVITWEYRLQHLAGLFSDKLLKNSIECCSTLECNNQADIDAYAQGFLEEGYEGAIVRLLDGPYNLGHRSRSLLKIKPFYDAEFEVYGYYEGIGKFKGCATFVCRTADNLEFHACPKGTLEEKRYYYEHGEEYIGELLTVQYNNLTEDGIPQFPIGLGFRLKEDLPMKNGA